jgi:hypothetical protein
MRNSFMTSNPPINPSTFIAMLALYLSIKMLSWAIIQNESGSIHMALPTSYHYGMFLNIIE